jgi:hypothetical protein
MSAYRVHESAIRAQDAIIDALCDRARQHAMKRGKNADAAAEAVKAAVQVHAKPQNLVGYAGDTRKQKAHIVVPQQTVNDYLGGGASNDVGFLRRDDGTYEAIVSAYDEGCWWNQSAPRFWQIAQTWEAERAARLQGYYVQREEVRGNVQLVCVSR